MVALQARCGEGAGGRRWGSEAEGRQLSRPGAKVVKRRGRGGEIDRATRMAVIEIKGLDLLGFV